MNNTIKGLQIELENIKNESVEVPTDVGMAMGTNRWQLLRAIKRPMTEAEVVATVDAMAGVMRQNEVLQALVTEYETVTSSYEVLVDEVVKVINIRIRDIKAR
jgi:hypothetical protein